MPHTARYIMSNGFPVFYVWDSVSQMVHNVWSVVFYAVWWKGIHHPLWECWKVLSVKYTNTLKQIRIQIQKYTKVIRWSVWSMVFYDKKVSTVHVGWWCWKVLSDSIWYYPSVEKCCLIKRYPLSMWDRSVEKCCPSKATRMWRWSMLQREARSGNYTLASAATALCSVK